MENGLGLLAACLPSLGKLLSTYLENRETGVLAAEHGRLAAATIGGTPFSQPGIQLQNLKAQTVVTSSRNARTDSGQWQRLDDTNSVERSSTHSSPPDTSLIAEKAVGTNLSRRDDSRREEEEKAAKEDEKNPWTGGSFLASAKFSSAKRR